MVKINEIIKSINDGALVLENMKIMIVAFKEYTIKIITFMVRTKKSYKKNFKCHTRRKT